MSSIRGNIIPSKTADIEHQFPGRETATSPLPCLLVHLSMNGCRRYGRPRSAGNGLLSIIDSGARPGHHEIYRCHIGLAHRLPCSPA